MELLRLGLVVLGVVIGRVGVRLESRTGDEAGAEKGRYGSATRARRDLFTRITVSRQCQPIGAVR
jgi:hypothetical protein